MRSDALVVSASRSRSADFIALAKPRLNALAIATTAGGYYMGSSTGADLQTFLMSMAGTALVAGGASALNQLFERDPDARMHRTRLRPLPDGRLQPGEAALFGTVLSVTGLLLLAVGANFVAAIVALVTLASYAFVYTPLKRRTSFSTVVGAVPGALPPVIGWAAARGTVDPAALALFAIGFCWQLPHFLAIAWIYREDYERAGFPMLPVIEPDGGSTARQAVLYASALVPASLAPAALGLADAIYATGAALLGLLFLGLAIRFAMIRSVASARALFYGSLLYLPALWVLMVAGRN
ncbi:MAG TPA: heme o synthase [Vicinamibacterales bacterium]|jgi:protoheme IX farnesyltransferase|nr:heme o synthase [Vicinamibacterales bacterium]